MKKPIERPKVAPADPSLWCEQSQRSVSAGWTKEYQDIGYHCWRCKAESTFTAQDQKYTFEVLKAPIDQHRILCENCWKRSVEILKNLTKLEERWNEEKSVLRSDKDFLSQWLKLLEEREEYVPYRADTARKNMLKKLLANV